MSQWIKIAAVEECPPGVALERLAGEQIVALMNVDGEFFALDGVCPHQGGPLGKGCLAGAVITCPWHGWQFDVRDGQHCFSPSVSQPTLPVKVEADAVWVQVN